MYLNVPGHMMAQNGACRMKPGSGFPFTFPVSKDEVAWITIPRATHNPVIMNLEFYALLPVKQL
jgi:hypothetical protein